MSLVPVLDQLDLLAVELVAATNAAIVDVGAGDLSLSQWRMLVVLGGSGGSLRIHEIAERVGASMPSASRLVGRMERRGLVMSARDAIDLRGRRVALTADGEALRARVVQRRRAMIEERLGDLPQDPGLVVGLEALVRRMAGWM